MSNAKIAAGDALKFLGKLTYPEKCLSLWYSRIIFHCGTPPRIFYVHVEIAYAFTTWFPCIRITVRATEIYKITCTNSPHFLVIFQTKNSEFAIFKNIFDVRRNFMISHLPNSRIVPQHVTNFRNPARSIIFVYAAELNFCYVLGDTEKNGFEYYFVVVYFWCSHRTNIFNCNPYKSNVNVTKNYNVTCQNFYISCTITIL